MIHFLLSFISKPCLPSVAVRDNETTDYSPAGWRHCMNRVTLPLPLIQTASGLNGSDSRDTGRWIGSEARFRPTHSAGSARNHTSAPTQMTHSARSFVNTIMSPITNTRMTGAGNIFKTAAKLYEDEVVKLFSWVTTICNPVHGYQWIGEK